MTTYSDVPCAESNAPFMRKASSLVSLVSPSSFARCEWHRLGDAPESFNALRLAFFKLLASSIENPLRPPLLLGLLELSWLSFLVLHQCDFSSSVTMADVLCSVRGFSLSAMSCMTSSSSHPSLSALTLMLKWINWSLLTPRSSFARLYASAKMSG